jgi:hypothetical protein
MSDAVKDFVEVPRQFVKEGTQASRSSLPSASLLTMSYNTSVRQQVYQAHTKGSAVMHSLGISYLTESLRSPHRVHSALPGRRCWIRSHGIHWILRQADSHPNVSVFVMIIMKLNANRCCFVFSNNILV